MCARPPLPGILGTAGEPELECRDDSCCTRDSDTPCTTASDAPGPRPQTPCLLPLLRSQTLVTGSLPPAAAPLRSVKSGPAPLAGSLRTRGFSSFSSGLQKALASTLTGAADQNSPSMDLLSPPEAPCPSGSLCSTSGGSGAFEAPQKQPCSASIGSGAAGSQPGSMTLGGGCGPGFGHKSCSRGLGCCKGASMECGSATKEGDLGDEPLMGGPTSAGHSNPAVGQVDADSETPHKQVRAADGRGQLLSSKPRPGIAKVTSRRAAKRPVESDADVDADAGEDRWKPTFGDLEDLWRKDSDARSYCSFVCSAPAMCRGRQEGLGDSLPVIGVDTSRRKRLRVSRDIQHCF